jgi:hypothetical protein
MRKIIELDVNEIVPTREEVLALQGMAGRTNLPARISALLDSALDIFVKLAEPKGVMQDVSLSQFNELYAGEGLNSDESPVPGIVSQADGLAIMAATMGNALVAKSSEMFAQGGPALGFMIDAVNSSGAERLGKMMCAAFLSLLPEEKRNKGNLKAQYYCPGHCGWHISGQTKLFQALNAEKIGVSINPRWVMLPVKSISGVIAAGPIEIHRFKPAFSYCPQCKEHKCVQRLRILEGENQGPVNEPLFINRP